MNQTRIVYALVAAASTALGGCGGGASEGEFVQACMNQKGVQMVKMTEEMCRCAAKYSREHLEPKLQQAMVLNMQGRKQESEALVEGMSFDERAEFAMKQFEVVGACVVQPG
ncbi:MAG TPA: hypothetical protein VJT80_15415 [Steroidobacteraceae bacterium]|nr:hypothetical protein [Steroidobacteraceae bacterium]